MINLIKNKNNMNLKVIEELSNHELINMINNSRAYEKKHDLDYSKMLELMYKFYDNDNGVKTFTGTYIPQFKRQIHREIEKRFKKLIN